MVTVLPLASAAAPADPSPERARIRAVAEQLEAGFLAEMLRHAGLADPRQAQGGGAGESAFASFLADEYAAAFVRRGGIGLSEQLVRAIARQDAAGR